MKNHFIYSYVGNKRNEIQEIYKHLNFEGIDTIIETNCGSSAMSYYISLQQPQRFKYILNDNDDILINIYNILKDEQKTNELNAEVNNIIDVFNLLEDDKTRKHYWDKTIANNLDNINKYVFYHKYAVLGRMCPQFVRCKQIKHCNINDYDIIKFLREENVTILKGDDIDIIEQNKNKKNVLMLIDPPYLQTYNSFYQNKDMNIYEYLNANPIKKMKAKIYLILEKNWIIDLLLKGNNVLLTTDKTYQISKKKTSHYVISNQKPLI